MLYDRKVKYLDYLEGGVRVRGGGFAKLEARDGTLRVELSVTGLHQTDTFARDVMLCGRNREGRDREENCGRIEISAGRGQFRQQWRNLEDIGGTGIGYGELCGLRIPLGPGREVSCRWQADSGGARRQPDDAGRKAARIAAPDGGREVRKEGTAAGAVVPDGGSDNRRRAGAAEDSGSLEILTEDDRDIVLREAVQEDGFRTATEGKEVIMEETAKGNVFREEIAEESGPEGRLEKADALEEAEPRPEGGAVRSGTKERPESELRGSSVEGAAGGEWVRKGAGNMAVSMKHTAGETYGDAERRRASDGREADGGHGRMSVEWTGHYDGSGKMPVEMGHQSRREAASGEGVQNARRGSAVEWEDPGNRRNRVSMEASSHEDGSADGRNDGAIGQNAPGHRRTAAKATAEPGRRPARLMEDKWQQLWAIYPHIRPFQDAREYLSIGPSDFVLFSEDSYRAVNNSFLLHGYYNYHHLLLARVEHKGEDCYYIGVPGNFYEREKQVAIMFGFESFECAEEPAQPGDFGYYMMRAQI